MLCTETLGYGSEGSTVVAPYERGLASWPESAGCVSFLQVLLEPDYQEVLNCKHSLLLRADEVLPGPAKVYWGKTVRENRDEYVCFVQDLLRRDMVELRDELELSIQDIADCLYQFRVPEYMVLPMGFSWAVRCAQRAHRELLRRGGLGGIEGGLVDRQLAPVVAAMSAPRAARVDSEIFVSNRAGGSRGARRQAAKVMAGVGLPLHDVEVGENLVEALGPELDGVELRARLAQGKRWRLLQGAKALLRQRRAASREVEKMVGHFARAMLLNRPSLSVFRSVYDFVRKHYRHPVPLWPSARQEFANAVGPLPPLAAQFDLPWSSSVTCSDATLRGEAAHGASIDPKAVRDVARRPRELALETDTD
ncbi:unnamed protein product, partial [Prorocentrum cordatum]